MIEKKFIVQATIPVDVEVYATNEDEAERAASATLQETFCEYMDPVYSYPPIIHDVAEVGDCLPGDISNLDFL